MQVIDFHTHLLKREMLTPSHRDFLKETNPRFFERIDEYAKRPEMFASYLRGQGVSYAVVLPEYAPATSTFVPTEDVIDYCKGQDILIPFASLNPNTHPDPAAKLRTFVTECGVRGLKLLPSYQFFYPNEPRLYPLYSVAQDLRIPVVFHIGSSLFKGTRMKYCDPIYLDDVAVDFPDLRIVMAHSGRGFWYEKCFFLSRLHKNIYMDVTGLPPKNLLNYFPDLDKNSDKVLFGSDWPAMPSEVKANIDGILSLPLKDSTISKMLFENASKILFES
ncbi:MAG: amidohydrolase [Deltaproteobacteria bacterium]|nr:amidohydrolase [Deltaproteobacteria bacterium]MBW2137988.1 amidohydrolase [Deltaproteobacteria bacterium]